MSRTITVATTAFGRLRNSDRDANLLLAQSAIEAAGRSGANLVCLPETFLAAGVPWDDAVATAETIPGPAFDTVTSLAREYGMYLVAGFYENRGPKLFNTAVLVDPSGKLLGSYDKIHPIIPEMDRGVIPGSELGVFPTEFGQVGIAICFDIGWPRQWESLKTAGAEVVFWPSAYDGGFPLRAYAWQHRFHVVSAVESSHAQIIDPAGQPLASTTEYTRTAVAEIDLETEVFHVDYHTAKINELPRRFGACASLRTYESEGLFTVGANDPSVSVGQIKAELGLESYRDYHDRVEAVQRDRREAAANGQGHGSWHSSE